MFLNVARCFSKVVQIMYFVSEYDVSIRGWTKDLSSLVLVYVPSGYMDTDKFVSKNALCFSLSGEL